VNKVHDVDGVMGWKVNEVHDMDDRCFSNVPLRFSIF
jgi:hypothetical protein